jgi:hypothetical protein
MPFTITKLMGPGTLVEGSDVTGREGRTILISDKWEMLQSVLAHKQATEEFNTQVEEFFKPLTEAADAAKAISHPEVKSWSRVTLTEASEGVDEEVIELDTDGVILRLLNETDGSMLRWIGEDVLVAIQQ